MTNKLSVTVKTNKGRQKLLRLFKQTKMPKIVGLYSRIATQSQRANGLSIPRQKGCLAEEARMRNFTNVRYYTDNGYSANDPNRPGYKKLLSDIKNGVVDTVIVYSCDRIVRNLKDSILFQELLDSHKGRFISITQRKGSDGK